MSPGPGRPTFLPFTNTCRRGGQFTPYVELVLYMNIPCRGLESPNVGVLDRTWNRYDYIHP